MKKEEEEEEGVFGQRILNCGSYLTPKSKAIGTRNLACGLVITKS